MLFVRKESFKQYLSFYPLTSCIVFLNVLVFLYTSIIGGLSNPDIVYKLGGISLEYLQENEYYRLISYAFIHNGWVHLFSNMVVVILFCPPIEKALGKAKFILFFALTILGCALAVIEFSTESSVGASGFGFGILGLYLSIILFRKELIDKESRIVILLLICIDWLYSFFNADVSISGHFGGFITGIILGAFFIYKKALKLFY